MLLFAGVSVLRMIPNLVLVLSTCMRSIISKKTNFEKMTHRMVLAVCGSCIAVFCCYIFSKSRTIYFHRRGQCSSWIFCTIYVCIPNVSLVVETASPLHACTVTVPCAHLLFSPLKSFSTSIVSPFHTL